VAAAWAWRRSVRNACVSAAEGGGDGGTAGDDGAAGAGVVLLGPVLLLLVDARWMWCGGCSRPDWGSPTPSGLLEGCRRCSGRAAAVATAAQRDCGGCTLFRPAVAEAG